MNPTLKAGTWLVLFLLIVVAVLFFCAGCTPIPYTDPTTGQTLQRPPPVQQWGDLLSALINKQLSSIEAAARAAEATRDTVNSPEVQGVAGRIPFGQAVTSAIAALAGGAALILRLMVHRAEAAAKHSEDRRMKQAGLTRDALGALSPEKAETVLARNG